MVTIRDRYHVTYSSQSGTWGGLRGERVMESDILKETDPKRTFMHDCGHVAL